MKKLTWDQKRYEIDYELISTLNVSIYDFYNGNSRQIYDMMKRCGMNMFYSNGEPVTSIDIECMYYEIAHEQYAQRGY